MVFPTILYYAHGVVVKGKVVDMQHQSILVDLLCIPIKHGYYYFANSHFQIIDHRHLYRTMKFINMSN